MFGKMMNNYYYGKSGKGDYTKNDLPKNRRQLFFAISGFISPITEKSAYTENPGIQ